VIKLEVCISTQKMYVFNNGRVSREYLISTGKNGAGEIQGSEQTPRGLHVIRARIGANCPVNTVFVGRRPTGEIYAPELRAKFPDRDWILTRICWLSGLEVSRNRLGNVDTMRRYIYLHGAPDDVLMGIPGSRGCVRMRNDDIIELFAQIAVGTQIYIRE
jgi:L,D-transpeptidase YbiS